MPTKKLLLLALAHTIGVVAYVALIALFMSNAQTLLGPKDTMFTPITVLMVFVLSAAITGSLVLGRPVLLYLDGKKSDAVRFFCYTLGWLFLFTVADIVIQALMR